LKYLLLLILFLSPLISHSQTYFLLSDSQKEYLEYKILLLDVRDYPPSQPASNEQIFNIVSTDTSFHGQSIKHIIIKPKSTLHVGTSATTYLNRNNSGVLTNLYGIYRQGGTHAVFNYRADSDYQKNDKYFGSVGKFGSNVIGRITDSYILHAKGPFSFFYGRQSRNYGLLTSPSLILSDYPFSYDHFLFEYETHYFNYSYLTTRLEDKDAYDIRDDIIESTWQKRFLSFHRLDISISDNLKVSLSESVLYGGSTQTMLPMYLNPMNIWFISKMVERKGVEESNVNALMAFDILYKPKANIIFYQQILIDDMDFTKEARERYPDRIGYTGKVFLLDLLPESLLSMEYVHISNWTYNSYYTFGNYTFYDMSLGYPLHGFEQFELKFNSFYLNKMTFSTSIFSRRAREQDMESPFIDIKTKFPIGTAQSSMGCKMGVSYLWSVKGSISLLMDYISHENFQNLEGQNSSSTNILMSFDYIL
jgi:hypothetical protein